MKDYDQQDNDLMVTNKGSLARPLCLNSWSLCFWREGYSFFVVRELTLALRSGLGEGPGESQKDPLSSLILDYLV